jgi:tripartite-type tricarboxylate transporter receptor subunit TctC
MLSGKVGNALTHIPYTGPGGALTDLMGGRLQAIFPVIPMTVPHVRSGEMKVLAVFSDKRSPILPEVPSTAEQGQPELVSDTCFMLLAPTGVPAATLERLTRSLNETMADAAIKQRLLEMASTSRAGRPRRSAIISMWRFAARGAGEGVGGDGSVGFGL